MADSGDRAREEFLSEAQEIVEAFNRDLLQLDEGRAQNRYDPAVLNDAFRAVHSLKGLAGLFGLARMTNLSHNLENLLDSLRMGRVNVTPEILDLLFEAVEVYNRIIRETDAGEAGDSRDVDELILRLDRASSQAPKNEDEGLAAYDLDPRGSWHWRMELTGKDSWVEIADPARDDASADHSSGSMPSPVTAEIGYSFSLRRVHHCFNFLSLSGLATSTFEATISTGFFSRSAPKLESSPTITSTSFRTSVRPLESETSTR